MCSCARCDDCVQPRSKSRKVCFRCRDRRCVCKVCGQKRKKDDPAKPCGCTQGKQLVPPPAVANVAQPNILFALELPSLRDGAGLDENLGGGLYTGEGDWQPLWNEPPAAAHRSEPALRPGSALILPQVPMIAACPPTGRRIDSATAADDCATAKLTLGCKLSGGQGEFTVSSGDGSLPVSSDHTDVVQLAQIDLGKRSFVTASSTANIVINNDPESKRIRPCCSFWSMLQPIKMFEGQTKRSVATLQLLLRALAMDDVQDKEETYTAAWDMMMETNGMVFSSIFDAVFNRSYSPTAFQMCLTVELLSGFVTCASQLRVDTNVDCANTMAVLVLVGFVSFSFDLSSTTLSKLNNRPSALTFGMVLHCLELTSEMRQTGAAERPAAAAAAGGANPRLNKELLLSMVRDGILHIKQRYGFMWTLICNMVGGQLEHSAAFVSSLYDDYDKPGVAVASPQKGCPLAPVDSLYSSAQDHFESGDATGSIVRKLAKLHQAIGCEERVRHLLTLEFG